METYINGVKLYYEDEGKGTPVVLVHGFPLNGEMWRRQVEALVPAYRVIVPDMRGFGRSEILEGPSPMETFADDLAGLLDVLSIDRAVVGGLSMGGYISFAFLRRHPERLRGLIFANTRATADNEAARAKREPTAQLVETEGVGALADSMIPKLLSDSALEELRGHVWRIIEQNQPAGLAAAVRGMAMRPDSSELLADIKVPVLVVASEHDALSPPAEMRTLHDAIAGSRWVEVPAAAHASNIENPAAFNAALLAFMQGV